MSTSQVASPTRAAAALHRRRVPWTVLAWLTWRQHRWALLATGFVVGLGVAFFLSAPAQLPTLSCMPDGAECWLDRDIVYTWAIVGLWLTPAMPGVVAAFWGAPMVAREYEHRTYRLAWSQDVSPGRWLLMRLALLTSVAAALAAFLAISAQRTLRALDLPGESWDEFHGPWDKVPYETTPVLSIPYVAAALSVGVLASVLLKRTLPAIVAALVTVSAIRLAVAAMRPRLLPPEHLLVPSSTAIPSITSIRLVRWILARRGSTNRGGPWRSAFRTGFSTSSAHALPMRAPRTLASTTSRWTGSRCSGSWRPGSSSRSPRVRSPFRCGSCSAGARSNGHQGSRGR